MTIYMVLEDVGISYLRSYMEPSGSQGRKRRRHGGHVPEQDTWHGPLGGAQLDPSREARNTCVEFQEGHKPKIGFFGTSSKGLLGSIFVNLIVGNSQVEEQVQPKHTVGPV